MKPSDRALLLRVAVGMAAPPVLGAVLVAIAGWSFNAQARAALAFSALGGGALVGGIQLWDRRRDADLEIHVPGLDDLQVGISNLTENLAGLKPPALPPSPPSHPEVPAIPVVGYTVPPTAPMAAPRSRVDAPDPNGSRLISEADLIADDTSDLWADNHGQNPSYSGGFHP